MDPRLVPYFGYPRPVTHFGYRRPVTYFGQPRRRFYSQYDRQMLQRPRHRYQYRIPFPIAFGMRYDGRHREIQQGSGRFNMNRFISETLQLHNQYRARHCAGPLKLDPTLNEIAQSYAEHLAQTSTFEHSGNKLGGKHLGENLYMKWISDGHISTTAKDAVKSWYDEISLYDYSNPTFHKDTGHFTQLVWRETKRLGVGIAWSPDQREVYVVTNYFPGGNIMGGHYFEKNVLPPNC